MTAAAEVLIVEDEGIIAADLQDRLESFGYQVVGTVSSGEEAIERVELHVPDLVLMDVRLEGKLDGIETAGKISQQFDVPAVFVTAYADDELLERAAHTNAYGYVLKPIAEGELSRAIKIALYKHQIEKTRLELLGNPSEELVAQILDATVGTLIEILGMAAPQALAQGQKLKSYMATFARWLKLEETRDLELAGLLCKIGQVSIPPTVVQKLRAGLNLTVLERDLVERVPELGAKLLSRIPKFESIAEMILFQNKNFDGTGFPPIVEMGGIKLPLGARMLRILIDVLELEAWNLPRGGITEQLRLLSDRYDPKLLKEAITCLVEAPPVGSRPVKREELRVGQVLAAPIETVEGTVLVGSGAQVSGHVLEKIMKFTELNSIREPIYVKIENPE